MGPWGHPVGPRGHPVGCGGGPFACGPGPKQSTSAMSHWTNCVRFFYEGNLLAVQAAASTAGEQHVGRCCLVFFVG